jgi:hypothetical protein
MYYNALFKKDKQGQGKYDCIPDLSVHSRVILRNTAKPAISAIDMANR